MRNPRADASGYSQIAYQMVYVLNITKTPDSNSNQNFMTDSLTYIQIMTYISLGIVVESYSLKFWLRKLQGQ